jgi:hypothetical protein
MSVNQVSLVTCSDSFPITATARDTSGSACVGIQVRFNQIEVDAATDVALVFGPGSATTDSLGQVTTTLTVSSGSCQDNCEGGTCQGRFEAAAGTITSPTVDVVDNVP